MSWNSTHCYKVVTNWWLCLFFGLIVPLEATPCSSLVIKSSIRLTNASNGHSGLQNLHCAVHRSLDWRKGADGRHHGLWDAVQTQSGLGDDPQGALWAHQEVGQVVACRGLSVLAWRRERGSVRPIVTGRSRMSLCVCVPVVSALPGCVYDSPIGQHHLQVEDVLSHSSITNSIGSWCAGGSHAAQRSICTRIWSETKQWLVSSSRQAKCHNGYKHLTDTSPRRTDITTYLWYHNYSHCVSILS